MSPHRTDEAALPDFDDAALGRGLPPEAESLIARAGRLRHVPDEALALLLAARAQAPAHPAPLIALYRFHFYGHRLREARQVAEEALAVAHTALGPDFGTVAPDEAAARFDAAVRFYLFSLKGCAYLSLRLGELDAGRAALAELRRLDPHDHVGGALLARVLARQGTDDDETPTDLPPLDDSGRPLAPRGWGPEVPR